MPDDPNFPPTTSPPGAPPFNPIDVPPPVAPTPTPQPIPPEPGPIAPEPTPISPLPLEAPSTEPSRSVEGPPPPAETPSTPVESSIFKRLLPFIAALLGLALLFLLVTRVILPLFTKSKPSSKSPQPVTLTYWGLWEDTSTIQAILQNYQTQNPHVTVNYQPQSYKDYRERLQSALARGDGPDIFRFHNTWVPMLKNELAPVPATVFDSTTFATVFYPVMQTDLVVAGTPVGIPLMYDGLALLYNTKIFSAAGKTPPQTWEQLRQTAFDLTIRDAGGKIQTAGIALGTTGNVDHWPDILAVMMFQNGANPKNPTGEPAESALKFYTIFNLSDRVWDSTLPGSVYAFATEKVAMIFAPSWEIHTLLQINPNLEFGVLPLPQLPTTKATWASYWVEGVSKRSTKTEEAFKLLKYLSDKQTLVNFYTEASKIRKFGEIYPRKDLADSLKNDPVVGPYISQADSAKSFYLSSRTFDNGINDKIIKYYEDAVNAVNQGADPVDSLQTVAQGVQQVLAQYGLE